MSSAPKTTPRDITNDKSAAKEVPSESNMPVDVRLQQTEPSKVVASVDEVVVLPVKDDSKDLAEQEPNEPEFLIPKGIMVAAPKFPWSPNYG